MNRRDALHQLAALGGSAFASPIVRAALSGAPLHTPPATSVLTAPQKTMVAELAELVIPTTDTPGAIVAGVPAFIDHIVSAWYSEVERKTFLDGLAALDAFGGAHFGKSFVHCTTSERTAALSAAEDAAKGFQPRPTLGGFPEPELTAPFFYQLKELTVLGYYTSEIGATQELSYLPIPGRYEGDYDFAGKQWSS